MHGLCLHFSGEAIVVNHILSFVANQWWKILDTWKTEEFPAGCQDFHNMSP